MFIPAINEMRYAGRRIADALAIIVLVEKTPEQLKQIDEHLIIAKSYLINADHDITDGVIFIVIRLVDAVIRAHGQNKIVNNYPSFLEAYSALAESQRLIQDSREDRNKRIEDYRKIADEYLPKLTKLYTALLDNRELALADTAAELGGISERVDIAALFAMGAAAGFLALIFSIFGWIVPWSRFDNWFH